MAITHQPPLERSQIKNPLRLFLSALFLCALIAAAGRVGGVAVFGCSHVRLPGDEERLHIHDK